jgi:DNA-binding response OmpR family regulator
MADSVLLIDDDPGVKKEVTSALNEAHFVVREVSDDFEILTEPIDFKVDIVIVDEEVRDYMEICHQYTNAGIPIILIGENKNEEIWSKAIEEAGAEFYIQKPISQMVLVARINAILRRYKH